jgi:membrane protein implicated in regulation of membrane protease activity
VIYILWFALGVGLLLAELHTAAFYPIFLGVGALVAGVLAFLAPDSAIWVQAGVALAVSVIGVVLIRPRFARRYLQRSASGGSRGVHGGFVGERALATDPIGDELHPGHVRLSGETWLAISHDGREIGGDAPVIVTAVRGTTLVVRPAVEPAASGVPA